MEIQNKDGITQTLIFMRQKNKITLFFLFLLVVGSCTSSHQSTDFKIFDNLEEAYGECIKLDKELLLVFDNCIGNQEYLKAITSNPKIRGIVSKNFVLVYTCLDKEYSTNEIWFDKIFSLKTRHERDSNKLYELINYFNPEYYGQFIVITDKDFKNSSAVYQELREPEVNIKRLLENHVAENK